MGAIERIAAIWKANLNEALDRIEDPAKMVDQIVRDVERAVDQAVAALVKARATKRRLARVARDFQRNTEQMQMWQAKAAAAVEAGNDEGARLALIQKTELDQAHVRLEPALAESCDTVVQLEEQVETLRQKLRDIRARRGKLIARCCVEREHGVAFGEDAPALRFAAIAQRVQQSERELTRFEEQVDQAAAEAEVLRELAAERRGERDRKVAEELAALKAASPRL